MKLDVFAMERMQSTFENLVDFNLSESGVRPLTLAINSTGLVTRLRQQKSVLVVPGDHFGMDGYARIGYGDEAECLREGLNRLHDLLEEIRGVRRVSYDHA